MKKEPTQKTQPRGKNDDGTPAEPVDIPIPTREQVFRDLAKSAEVVRAASRDVCESADETVARAEKTIARSRLSRERRPKK